MGDTPGSMDVLTRLDRDLPGRYRNLRAHVRRSLGVIRFLAGALSQSLALYESASRELEATGDLSWLAHVLYLTSENLRWLGDSERAWQLRLKALRVAWDSSLPERAQAAIWDGANALADEGHLAAALSFENELVHLCATSSPELLATALLTRSRTLHALGRRDEAAADLDRARASIETIREGAVRERAVAELDVTSGTLGIGPTDQGVEKLGSAVRYFRRAGHRYRVAAARQALANVHMRLGRPDDAELELDGALAELETQNSQLASPQQRASHLASVRSVYDDLILLKAIGRGRVDDALLTAERCRTRLLATRLSRPATAADDLSQQTSLRTFRASLPPRSVAVFFAFAKDTLLTWLVLPHENRFWSRRVASDMLQSRIHALRSLLAASAGRSEWAHAAAELHELLLPHVSELGDAATIVLIPDGMLRAVPFSALLDGSGRYLIEKHVLVVAPNMSSYVASVSRDAGRALTSSALIVGDPARATDALAALPGAQLEVDAISSLYAEAVVLRGAEATLGRFLTHAAERQVIHYAGHAVPNSASPETSSLLFAADRPGGEPARFTAHDAATLELPATRVVILAACRTTSEPAEGAAVADLAAGFLAAGVPSVVASLWDVDDEATVELMRALHQRLRRGVDSARALREAQLEMLRARRTSGSTADVWAAFQVIGGADQAFDRN
jgi:CHAT domain-containing protein